jgi:CelD/BcsL family acetyltransferase involved in cellulose biosynthesis
VKIVVVPARALTPEHRSHWERIYVSEASLDSPFFSPELTRIVAGAREDVFVAVIDDGRHMGFFPFQRGRGPAGRPVGGPLCDYHGLLAPAGIDVDADELLGACGLRTWAFDGLPASQELFRRFHARTKLSYRIDLRAGFESWAHERSAAGSEQVRDAIAQGRRLERDLGPVTFVADLRDPAAFTTLGRWKSAQYERTGAIDVFGIPWVRDVLEAVRGSRTESFAGMLSGLYAGDDLVAVHFGMRSRSVWHYWLPAYDPARARYSPGLVLLVEMARSAGELGLEWIDLGKGEALYKSRLTNGGVVLAEGLAASPAALAAVRRVGAAVSAVLRRTPVGPRLAAARRRGRFT